MQTESARRSEFFFPGQAEKDEAVFLSWSGYRHCLPNHSIGWRTLRQFEVVFVVCGSGVLKTGGKELPLQSGDVFFLFPGEAHYYATCPDDPWHLKWVAFEGVKCAQLLQEAGVLPDEPVLHGLLTGEMDHAVDGILDNMYRMHRLAALGYFYILLDALSAAIRKQRCTTDEAGEQTRLMKRIMLFLSAHYNEEINVDVVCLRINYSRSYVSHLFKKETGMSMPQMINTIRLQKAQELLKETRMSTAEIARSVGYGDSAYFCRLFRKEYGVTPNRFRVWDES